MQQAAIDAVMGEDQRVFFHADVGEAVNVFAVRHRPFWMLQLACFGTTTAGKDVGGEFAFQLQVLEIMIVTADVSVDLMLLQQRLPLGNDRLRVTMIAIGIKGMMGHHEREGSSWLGQLRFQPFQLCSLLG